MAPDLNIAVGSRASNGSFMWGAALARVCVCLKGSYAVGAHESRVYCGPGRGGRWRTLPSAFQSHSGPHFPEFLSGREGEVAHLTIRIGDDNSFFVCVCVCKAAGIVNFDKRKRRKAEWLGCFSRCMSWSVPVIIWRQIQTCLSVCQIWLGFQVRRCLVLPAEVQKFLWKPWIIWPGVIWWPLIWSETQLSDANVTTALVRTRFTRSGLSEN